MGNHLDGVLWEGCRSDGLPNRLIEVIRFDVFFHGLSGSIQIDGPLGITGGELQSSIDHLLDICTAFDLGSVSAVLRDNGLLVRYVLDPVDVLGP